MILLHKNEASYTPCSSRFQILHVKALIQIDQVEDHNGINWGILSQASLLAMILGLFSMLLGTGIQVYTEL